jgi:hypothetical protein
MTINVLTPMQEASTPVVEVVHKLLLFVGKIHLTDPHETSRWVS